MSFRAAHGRSTLSFTARGSKPQPPTNLRSVKVRRKTLVNKEHRKDSSGKKLHRKKKKVAISRTLEKKRLAEPSSNRAGSSKEEFKKLLHKAIDLDQLIVIETEMLRGDASEPSNEKERDATVARIEDYAMQNSEKLYEIEKLVLQQLR